MLSFFKKLKPKRPINHPINFDFDKLIYDEKINVCACDIKGETLDKIANTNKDVIYTRYTNMNKSAFASKMIENKFAFDMITLSFGFLGREYNKTLSMKFEKSILIQVLSGSGYVIMENGESLKVVSVSKNSFVYVPKKYSFVIINSNFNQYLSLVIARDNESKVSLGSLKSNAGTSLYYLKSGFKKNMNSKGDYKLEEYDKEYIPNITVNYDVSLYDQILEDTEKFGFINHS